ncbi:type II toxin-antitoxin system YoeB family toxin [Synechocystis sp. LEGE 06083]|nr:type II toxin-antitoxin system YoeB family toxin [Synechocystis sp. LEGE 06083]
MEQRLVYQAKDDSVYFLQAGYHYTP